MILKQTESEDDKMLRATHYLLRGQDRSSSCSSVAVARRVYCFLCSIFGRISSDSPFSFRMPHDILHVIYVERGTNENYVTQSIGA